METELCCGQCCNVVATEHGRYGLSCTYVETVVHEQCWVCIASVLECYSVSYVVKFYGYGNCYNHLLTAVLFIILFFCSFCLFVELTSCRPCL